MIRQINPLEYFLLKPVKAAKVSEVSETTASSNIPAEDRVNFHIGNPVQDKQLYSAYLRMALGININENKFTEDNLDDILEEVEWEKEERLKLEFLLSLIKNSAPYMPRGGYQKKNPNFLVKYFNEWLVKNQQEPLSYDLGETSGKREIILTTGGKIEALRLLFHTLSNYLITRPAKIFLFNFDLPDHLKNFSYLQFESLPNVEDKLIYRLQSSFQDQPDRPTFILLGKITEEETRRNLRQLSLEEPLFFIEVNDAPNHLSLAREAKMMNRVLRILTPGIFSEQLCNLSTGFIAGNSDFIRIIETVQFQLKGTPSASEVEFLSFLLKENLFFNFHANKKENISVEPVYENSSLPIAGNNSIQSYAKKFENKLNELIGGKVELAEDVLNRISRSEINLEKKAHRISSLLRFDKHCNIDTKELLDELVENINSESSTNELVNSFLFSFQKHHPEYRFQNSIVVSGSSRTALGLFGFHCGIREVIIPDLSWTYEHCFPSVAVVPLRDDYELDVDGIIETVQKKLKADNRWRNYSAVVLNNPHNATGKKFDEEKLKQLVRWLVEREIFVIDDLSYQNVAPSEFLDEIKTIRQLTNKLLSNGYINNEQSNRVITVHSLSKTDSFAGARLSVVEVRHNELFEKFKKINSTVVPNIAAIFLAYLFYRNKSETANAYWRLRNKIFAGRMNALEEAVNFLPKVRNRFDIKIKPPQGSMYPQLIIDKLPAGLSLDWLASGLARQGIGFVPLSTFARTEKGFETSRKTYRLTLGGTDDDAALRKKTRRMIIDLNRMIAEEAANYNRKEFNLKPVNGKKLLLNQHYSEEWKQIEQKIKEECARKARLRFHQFNDKFRTPDYIKRFENEFLPQKLSLFQQRFDDRLKINRTLVEIALADKGKNLIESLEKEFYKDTLERREKEFKQRLYDRTVHPTQMYSLKVELYFEEIIEKVIKNRNISAELFRKTAEELIKEFLGLDVAIVSGEEPAELILDLKTIIAAENYTNLNCDQPASPGLQRGEPFQTFLSFWGDWDGSNRPSGQGHSLVASVLIENVARQSKLLQLILKYDKSANIDSSLLEEIEKLHETNNRFTNLLNQITLLTHQLEKRYRGILPYNLKPGRLRRFGMKLHIAQDPLTTLWHHNDRLERKMVELRQQRKSTLEYYFSLNKELRKTLHSLLPTIQKQIGNQDLLLEASSFKDLLKRFVITPRIHQKMITAQDQFAIDTTVHNINEINELAGKYGNPGMVMALQISMSTKPEALISLDRKMRARRQQILRENSDADLPSVWLVPLFEDMDAVKNLKNYLNKIWEYSLQSRRLNQETCERFSEIISEVFVAGSDLSQQVGQAAGMNLFREAKFELTTWLADKGLIGKVRMKMGSGEPMQRQGGYYSDVAGKSAFIKSEDSMKRFSGYLNESTKKSTEYATTPLMGVFAGGDLRTFQSSISEKLRFLSVSELSQLLFHIKESQIFYETEIVRAGEPLIETRLQFRTRGLQELERLTIGRKDNLFDEFLSILSENFRQVLYGREEDVVGIHIISYFIARTTPPLRDRPTIRPGQSVQENEGQKILEKIAGTIPLSRYGSLLRAIAHNQSQTTILGINQLTTGLFRALDSFSQKQFAEGESAAIIEDRILPNLPVYEILHTLRIYHDVDLNYLNKMENAFPAGISAFLALREDVDSLNKYLILFQRELLRRHGLEVKDFFESDKFIADLLPALRPDLAVLLQPNLFNTSAEVFLSSITGNVDAKWLSETKKLLAVPEEVKYWREKIWDLLSQPVFQKVASFVELALALYSLSQKPNTKELPFAPKKIKLPAEVSNYLRMPGDDNMHQFLTAAFEYLSVVSEGMVEVPINIIRAIKEVERIIKIEEQALTQQQQDLLRFYLLQIARITGENG